MSSSISSAESEPLINQNHSLQAYYASLESRIGYRLVLGGTRHFGLYPAGTYWPFPISKALRAMEDHLIDTLDLEKGSEILDAGCGAGYVAVHLAEQGYRVHGIDVVDHHIVKARRNAEAHGLQQKITITKGDYHHLSAFSNDSFDGAYTMETFVHATEPEVAAAEFFRVLRPGGSIAMYEYDHVDFSTEPAEVRNSWTTINKHASMPAYDRFQRGVLKGILEDAGFENVEIRDLSDNVLPMLRLFYILAFIPYLIIAFLGLKARFINTVAGYEGYIYRDAVRYIAVSAKKPSTGALAESREEKKLR
ncbi:S-adenosyl-L-methionine-dependent methyltransferase [Cadophora sp. DSE1049]|nr:S-adenosyl-L-methionine-dependent methyltransferase [Cadophora sp. DSE1049]